MHWTGKANKYINNRWTIWQGWTPFPWGKQAALPLHPCPAPSHGKARKHEALEGQNWHRSHRRIAFFSKFEVWIFICKDSSVAHSLIKLLFSCCIALPITAFTLPRPKDLVKRKKCCPVHPCNVRPTCHASLMLRVGRWIALGKTFLRKKCFLLGIALPECLHFFSNFIFGLILHRCKCFEPWTFMLSIYVSLPSSNVFANLSFLWAFPCK